MTEMVNLRSCPLSKEWWRKVPLLSKPQVLLPLVIFSYCRKLKKAGQIIEMILTLSKVHSDFLIILKKMPVGELELCAVYLYCPSAW